MAMEGYSSSAARVARTRSVIARGLNARAAGSSRTVFSSPFKPTVSRGIKNQAAESTPQPIYLFLTYFVRKFSVETDFFMGYHAGWIKEMEIGFNV